MTEIYEPVKPWVPSSSRLGAPKSDCAHGPLTARQSLLRPSLNDPPGRYRKLSKSMGDIKEVVAAIAIVSTLDQDQALRRRLGRYADCPDDQLLNLELPVGCGGLQLRPDGSIHPVRAAETQPATNFDHLVAQSTQSVELESMIERARLKRPFLALGPADCFPRNWADRAQHFVKAPRFRGDPRYPWLGAEHERSRRASCLEDRRSDGD